MVPEIKAEIQEVETKVQLAETQAKTLWAKLLSLRLRSPVYFKE